LESLNKVEIQNKTVLNTKGTKLSSKQSMNMVSPPQKLLLEAHSHQFITQNPREGFWQPRGIPGNETVVRNERWDGLFIGKVCHELSDKAGDIRQP
jgi:hypothetical protein